MNVNDKKIQKVVVACFVDGGEPVVFELRDLKEFNLTFDKETVRDDARTNGVGIVTYKHSGNATLRFDASGKFP